MCGFAGCFDPPARAGADELTAIVHGMGQAIRYRGPDDAGTWCEPDAGIAFAHCRLSIIDLSAAGHQPMTSRCGRYTLAYNGEVYNFEQLRTDLGPDVVLRGHSDTEVLIESIAKWGLAETLPRLNGMFAFALWDQRERKLHLVRDRLGIKPLYYGVCGGVFLFGSELKSLRQHPAFDAEIDREAIGDLLEHCYIPASRSIYAGVARLPPAHVLTVDAATLQAPLLSRYWSIPFDAPPADNWDERFAELLQDAIRLRMLADVPLGAFLSGGIDSSLVVAQMQSLSDRPVRTFTVGFQESDYNEAPHAAAVARHLGTEHTELYVTAEQARDVIPRLPEIYDEPFADVSQIPTWLVSQLAREHVTVSLSGDGGDELFGGYDRYRHIRQIYSYRRRASVLLRVPGAAWLADRLLQLTGRSGMRGVLAQQNIDQMYRYLHRHWREPRDLVVGYQGEQGDDFRQAVPLGDTPAGHLVTMMAIDQQAYLPDDILVKVDRASMNVSLEARVPLLDHRVVEHAWRLDAGRRLKGSVGKEPLRRLLAESVPAALFDRPKMGFGVPIDSWLRGPLRDWAEELLSEDRLRCEGYLNPVPIRQKWNEHLSGVTDWHYLLWDVLMFQSWLNSDAGLS